MTVRRFDPVFSAALRDELVGRAAATRRSAPGTSALRRPTVWITAVIAVLLAIATVGVLRIVHPTAPTPAAPSVAPPARITDALREVEDPHSDRFVSRTPDVLLEDRGAGTPDDALTFVVPSDVTRVRVVLTCADGGHDQLSLGRYAAVGTCDPDRGAALDVAVAPGSRQHLTRWVLDDTEYSVVVVALPADTSARP